MNVIIRGNQYTLSDIKIDIQKPNPNADSDWDFKGHTDIEFKVHDWAGEPADEILETLSSSEIANLYRRIIKHEDDRRAL